MPSTAPSNLSPFEQALLSAGQSLLRSPYAAVRGVRVCIRDGVLVLFGAVSCFYHKQQAQTTVLHAIAGSVGIENQIIVSDPNRKEAAETAPERRADSLGSDE